MSHSTSTGEIPDPEQVDPSCKFIDMGIVELANIMLKTPWEDLPEDLRKLRGFFTKSSYRHFQDTMLLPKKGGEYVSFFFWSILFERKTNLDSSNNREIAADSNVGSHLN